MAKKDKPKPKKESKETSPEQKTEPGSGYGGRQNSEMQ